MVASYLAAYQLPGVPDAFHQFTLEAVASLVGACAYHPRAFLAWAHYLVEVAEAGGVCPLDIAFVATHLPAGVGPDLGEGEGIDASLL